MRAFFFLFFFRGNQGKHQHGADDKDKADIIHQLKLCFQPDDRNDGGGQRLCGGVKTAFGRADIADAVQINQIGQHGAENDGKCQTKIGGNVPVALTFPHGVDKIHGDAAKEHGPADQEHGVVSGQQAHGVYRVKGQGNTAQQPPEQRQGRNAQAVDVAMGCQKEGADQCTCHGDGFYFCRHPAITDAQINNDHDRGKILQNGSSCRVAVVDGGEIAILGEQKAHQAEQQDIDAILFMEPDLEDAAMLHLIYRQQENAADEHAGGHQPFRRHARIAKKILARCAGKPPEAGRSNAENRPHQYFIFDTHM